MFVTLASLVLAISAPPSAVASVTPAPAAATADSDHAEDAIFALVQAGKCGQAKAAAEKAGDANLAGQIGLMCGARSSGAPSSKGEGGGRHGSGGGQAGGRRGGGS